jgi:hypothetical protein
MNKRTWRVGILCALAILVLASACQPLETPPDDRTVENAKLVSSNFLAAWNNFDLGAADAAFAED